jgi:hypothetical protein
VILGDWKPRLCRRKSTVLIELLPDHWIKVFIPALIPETAEFVARAIKNRSPKRADDQIQQIKAQNGHRREQKQPQTYKIGTIDVSARILNACWEDDFIKDRI